MLLLLVDCFMTGFPLSWALLAPLFSLVFNATLRPSELHTWSEAEKRYFLARFKTCRQKEKKMEIVIQDLDGSLSLSLSTKIPIYITRDLSMNRGYGVVR